mmetsp:Transcript_105160/g.224632  ORF Transcript_105160/g.224632 Transcript_105160/m.224632 type:complete len:298 (-) Transcript_105160:412-1305(-)
MAVRLRHKSRKLPVADVRIQAIYGHDVLTMGVASKNIDPARSNCNTAMISLHRHRLQWAPHFCTGIVEFGVREVLPNAMAPNNEDLAMHSRRCASVSGLAHSRKRQPLPIARIVALGHCQRLPAEISAPHHVDSPLGGGRCTFEARGGHRLQAFPQVFGRIKSLGLVQNIAEAQSPEHIDDASKSTGTSMRVRPVHGWQQLPPVRIGIEALWSELILKDPRLLKAIAEGAGIIEAWHIHTAHHVKFAPGRCCRAGSSRHAHGGQGLPRPSPWVEALGGIHGDATTAAAHINRRCLMG